MMRGIARADDALERQGVVSAGDFICARVLH